MKRLMQYWEDYIALQVGIKRDRHTITDDEYDQRYMEFFQKYDDLFKQTSQLLGGNDKVDINLHDSFLHSISSRRTLTGYDIKLRTYGFQFEDGKESSYPQFSLEFKSWCNFRELNNRTIDTFLVDDNHVMVSYFKGSKTPFLFLPFDSFNVVKLEK